MGRELKRVPLDFDWQLQKPWKGYVNDAGAGHICPECEGSGQSAAMRLLECVYHGYIPFSPASTGSTPFLYTDEVMQRSVKDKVERDPRYYGTGQEAIDREAARMADIYNGQWKHHLNEDDVTALLGAGLLKYMTHTQTKNGHWRRKKPAHVPTAQEVNLWLVENWMALEHNAVSAVVSAECQRQGYEMHCPHCDEGTVWASPEDKLKFENWEPTEPPAGEGYQMWETVSGGSPISPVFAYPEELARWLSRNPWGADRSSYAQWLRLITEDGYAPSLIVSDGEVRTGVDAMYPDERRVPRVRGVRYVMSDDRFGYRPFW